MNDLEFIDEEDNSQHPKEFASQGEEETNTLKGEANSLEETPTEDEVCGITSRNSSADIKIKKLEQIDKKDEEEIIKNEIIKQEKPEKPAPLPDYNKKDYLPTKEKKKYFWKILAIVSIIILILTIGGLMYLIKEGKLTPTFNSTSEIVNNYDFNPSINSPISNDYKNNFNNTVEINFDISDEFIEQICGNNS